MADLVRRSLRMNPSRVIVGEVLGDEIVTMLNAMSQGNDGSLSTIHSNSSMEVFNRISTYAIQAQERLPIEATQMLIAGALDFVVFVRKHNDYCRRRRPQPVRRERPGGRRPRRPGAVQRGVRARTRDGRAAAHAPIACVARARAASATSRSCTGRGPDDVEYDLDAGRSRSGVGVGRRRGAAAGAVAIRGIEPRDPTTPRSSAAASVDLRDRGIIRLVVGVAVGLVVLVVTRWLVLAVALGVLVGVMGPDLRRHR